MSDALEEAQRLYREALDAQRDQRRQIEEDLRFSDPSDPDQWDAMVRHARETDPGGKRPCLTLDQTGQYVQQVTGQIEQQTPSIHAIPVGGGADKLAAEQIDGRFRHIEHASRASQHYNRALTSAARAGVGYLVVRPEYIDRALGWQEPRIGSEPDPLKVVFDPWSQELDGKDASFGYILTPVSVREAQKRWKGKAERDFGDLEATKRDDSRRSVLIAEMWIKEEVTRNLIVYTDANGQPATATEDEFWKLHAAGQLPQQMEQPRAYTDRTTRIRWRRMSGSDVLEELKNPDGTEGEYQADCIGIIPVYGYVGFSDGRMKYCGIPRRARSAQQAYNYHKSELMMPGAQLLASKRAIAGVEPLWDRAQVQRRAYMPFNDQDADGQIAPPTLIKVGSSLVDHVAGAEGALRDLQASVAMFQANLGAPSNETSGVAIENRQRQGEAGNAHFPSHLAASLGQVGNIVMQMDARLTDTRRTQAIMGVDGTAGTVVVDPDQKQAAVRGKGGVSINPRVGTYGVRVVVGASYSTQRAQTNAAFGEIMRGNPDMAPTVAPFWAQTLDFPGADKFAQAMAEMAPPAVKAILKPEGAEDGPDPAALAEQLQQCQQALQEAIQHAKDAQDDADEAIAGQADAKRIAEVRERELDIKAYEAETNRFKVTGANEAQIQAVVRDLINQMLANPDPLPGDDEPQPQPEGPPGQPPMLPAGEATELEEPPETMTTQPAELGGMAEGADA